MDKDRRKFIRFDVPLKVEISIKADINYIKEATTKDFSREGVGLVLNDFDLEEGSKIKLKFFLPSLPEPIVSSASIKWAGKVKDKWQMGVKLDDIASADKSQILDYVYEKWRHQRKSPEINIDTNNPKNPVFFPNHISKTYTLS